MPPGHPGPLENQVLLDGLLEEFLDQMVIQEFQVNVAPQVQGDLQGGKDLVFLGLKELKVIVAIQDSKAILAHLAPRVPQVKDQKDKKVNRVQWEAQA